jgi:hypothetical protein
MLCKRTTCFNVLKLCMLATCFMLVSCLAYHEDGADMFLRNVG